MNYLLFSFSSCTLKIGYSVVLNNIAIFYYAKWIWNAPSWDSKPWLQNVPYSRELALKVLFASSFSIHALKLKSPKLIPKFLHCANELCEYTYIFTCFCCSCTRIFGSKSTQIFLCNQNVSTNALVQIP